MNGTIPSATGDGEGTRAYDFEDDLLSRLRDDYVICLQNGDVTQSALFDYHRRQLEESGTTFDPEDGEQVAKLCRQCVNYLDNHGYAPTKAQGKTVKRKPRTKDKTLKIVNLLCAKHHLRLADAPAAPRHAGGSPEISRGDIHTLYASIGDDPSYDEVYITLRTDLRSGAMLCLLGRAWLADMITEDTQAQCFFAVMAPRDHRIDADDAPYAGRSLAVEPQSLFTDPDTALEQYRIMAEDRLVTDFTYAHNYVAPEGCPASLRGFFESDDPLLDDNAWSLTPAEENDYRRFLDRLHR